MSTRLEAKIFGAIAVALLAGCAGTAAIPNQTTAAPNAFTPIGLDAIIPDKAPPKCKGQKNTKEYAKGATEDMKVSGGSLCVPEFDGWGGALQYPQTYGSAKYTDNLISSTTAYKGGYFPPGGSQKPIFYIQMAFDGFPGFYPTLPKGAPLVSSHLKPNKPYTAGLWVYFYALGWEEYGECYQVAKKSKYGGSLAGVGALFEKETFLEKISTIEIFAGQNASTQC